MTSRPRKGRPRRNLPPPRGGSQGRRIEEAARWGVERGGGSEAARIEEGRRWGVERGQGVEHGFVAGAEALIFGVLVFVFGTLIVLNGWVVVDAKFATNAAAREAVRAVVEAPAGVGRAELVARSEAAAAQAFATHGYDAEAVKVVPVALSGSQQRCSPVTIRAEISVKSTIVPGIAGPNTFTVRSTHEEVVDPFRSGLQGEAICGF